MAEEEEEEVAKRAVSLEATTLEKCYKLGYIQTLIFD